MWKDEIKKLKTTEVAGIDLYELEEKFKRMVSDLDDDDEYEYELMKTLYLNLAKEVKKTRQDIMRTRANTISESHGF